MAQAHRGVTGGIPHTCEVHTALLAPVRTACCPLQRDKQKESRWPQACVRATDQQSGWGAPLQETLSQ